MATPDEKTVPSNPFLAAILNGWYWAPDLGDDGAPLEITYFLAPGGTDLSLVFTPSGNYQLSVDWTETQSDAFRLALNQWENVADIVFTPVAAETDADLVEYATTLINGPVAVHYTPKAAAEDFDDVASGAYAFSSEFAADETLVVGGRGFQTLLHEIGHALGLEHPKSSWTSQWL